MFCAGHLAGQDVVTTGNQLSTGSLDSLQSIASTGSHEARAAAYDELSRYHRSVTEDYEQALFFQSRYHKLTDSVNEAAAQSRIEALETRAEVARQAHRIGELERTRRQQLEAEARRRAQYLILLIIVLSLAGSAFFVLRYNTRTRLARAETRVAASQLEVLHAQMNPHFIFNSLASIQHLILTSKKSEAVKYLGRFSDLLQLSLNQPTEMYQPFTDELQLLSAYLELEQLRFEGSFSTDIRVAPELRGTPMRVPAMMIQPHVENAIIHGLSNRGGGGRLKIDFSRFQGGLRVIIDDNGIGRAAAEGIAAANENFHLSIASGNTRKRIHALRQLGFSGASLVIEDLVGERGAAGTRVTLQLPLVTPST